MVWELTVYILFWQNQEIVQQNNVGNYYVITLQNGVKTSPNTNCIYCIYL